MRKCQPPTRSILIFNPKFEHTIPLVWDGHYMSLLALMAQSSDVLVIFWWKIWLCNRNTGLWCRIQSRPYQGCPLCLSSLFKHFLQKRTLWEKNTRDIVARYAGEWSKSIFTFFIYHFLGVFGLQTCSLSCSIIVIMSLLD